MKAHTNRFKEEIGSFGRQIDSIITYQLNGVTQTITSENLNSVTPTFQGAILKSVMKELDIDSNVDIPVGTILRYKFGVLVDGEYEYLDYGNYVVYSSKKQEDYNSYKIVCYDKMLYSMKQNEDLGVTYPISVRDYIDALCTKIGLEFKNKTDVFANYDKMITKELYVGQEYTYRDIFDELSQVTASTICLDIDDKVEIRYINKLTDLQIAEGTNITITDSEQDTINSLTLDGRCEQETTTGKNLLENTLLTTETTQNGVTATPNSDGSITLNGTATAHCYFNIAKIDFGTKSFNNYNKFSDDYKASTGSPQGIPSLGYDSSNKYTYINVTSGTSLNNFVVKPMVRLASITDDTYEPYTGGQPSPSPDYPQNISVLTGNLKLTSCDNGLFDGELRQGSWNSINDGTRCFNKNNIYVEPGDYLLITDLDINNYRYGILVSNDSFPIQVENFSYNSGWKQANKFEFSLTKSGNLGINISSIDNANINPSIFTNVKWLLIRLDLASVINITIPSNKFVGKIGDIKDTLNVVYKEDGHYHLMLNKMIDKVVLDGSENWTLSSSGFILGTGEVYKHFKDRNINILDGFCNYFVVEKSSTTWTKINCCGWNTEGVFWIRDDHKLASTTDDFKSWLSTHNTEVYYVLETPYEVDLGTIDEMPNTYKGTTHIFNSVDTNMSVTYVNGYETIDEEFLNDVNVNVAKKYGPINSIVLSRSAESDNVYLQDEDSVAKNGLCELKIVDNQIMNWNDRSDYLPDILDKLDGLEYYINDFVSTGVAYLELCDNYKLKVFDNIYNCILLNDELDVTQGLVENIHTDMPMETETDYTKADKTDRRINQTSLIVDKQTQEITALVSKTDNLETKTAQLRLDVDTIEGQISDIADVTTTSEGVGTLIMQNINESEPIYLKIYPKLGDIKYLYPAEDLYPSDTLFPKVKTLRFHCTSENYDAEYELSKDLLWLNNDVYDEFILDYDNSACYVIRRVGVNADGTKYALTNSKQEDLTYPTIKLISGDYEVSLVGQPSVYLYVRLMVQNIYTTQFATKVELNSRIKQTKDEIDLEVSKKVGNDEVISKINQTAETITIQANKVNISGMISAINNNTTTTINGDKITTGSITANKVSSDIITTGNFNAQKINADNITSGTLSADKISGGTITASNINLKGVSLTPSTSSIGGLNVVSGTISNSRMGLDTANGIVRVFNNNGGSMILSNAARLSATAGVGISSNSNGNISAPAKNLDLKACSGAIAYLGCMSDAAGKNEKSGVSCENGTLNLRSTGVIYANGVAIGGSSSKATKENIKDLSQQKKDELYNLIKEIPLKEYDYKEQYGKKENYGFIIEDIEDTKLNTLLHIVQNKKNKDMKNYSSEDLARLELVVIQELIKKNEILEKRIEKLERNDK